MAIQDFKVIQGHVFCGQWKDDKGLNNTMYIIMSASFPNVLKT